MSLNRKIIVGDVLDKIVGLPPSCIDVVITSPPYWGLRDYGIQGQWGLEKDFHLYLLNMQSFMKQVKRVLKKTGTCWINLGDSYSGSGKGAGGDLSKAKEVWAFEKRPQIVDIQEKSRFGIPERFYVQCIDDGWIARNHIVWSKANSMPSSVKDRFTNKWESLFFFAKEQKYYFNLDAVREKTVTDTKPFNIRVRENKTGHAQAKLGDLSWKASEEELATHNEKGERKQDSTLGADGKPIPTYKGFNERWKDRKWTPDMGTIAAKHSGNYDAEGSNLNNPAGKNPGDVFFINPRPFPEAHFATFPIDLPLKILKCACPPGGIVLDPFFGSGTTGIAAEMLGLDWVGIELKKEYADIALKRLKPYRNTKIDEV